MPRYRYRAYDAAGTQKSGEMEAASEARVLDSLRSAGLLPVEAVEQNGRKREDRWWERDLFASRTLQPVSLALFTRELSTLVKAEVPLDEALRIVAMQPMGSHVRNVVEETLRHLVEGASLSEAMDRQGRFGEFYCSMVRAGEATGNLTEVLRELAAVLERSVETRARLRSALIYPAVLVLMALAALIVIATILLPTFVPVFESAGAEPPFVIRAIIAVETVIVDYWIALAAMSLALSGACAVLWRHPQARLSRHRLVLRTPLLGETVALAESARIARTLASLIGSGMPMLGALRISQGVAGNAMFSAALAQTAEDVKEGGMLSRALQRQGIFPDLMPRLIAVGEETGRLEPMLRHLEAIFETQVQRRIERGLTLLSPSLTVVMGLLVGGLIMSVMSAVLGINQLAIR